jgi:hypothetical protein
MDWMDEAFHTEASREWAASLQPQDGLAAVRDALTMDGEVGRAAAEILYAMWWENPSFLGYAPAMAFVEACTERPSAEDLERAERTIFIEVYGAQLRAHLSAPMPPGGGPTSEDDVLRALDRVMHAISVRMPAFVLAMQGLSGLLAAASELSPRLVGLRYDTDPVAVFADGRQVSLQPTKASVCHLLHSLLVSPP